MGKKKRKHVTNQNYTITLKNIMTFFYSDIIYCLMDQIKYILEHDLYFYIYL
jgi:hypothetical protein